MAWRVLNLVPLVAVFAAGCGGQLVQSVPAASAGHPGAASVARSTAAVGAPAVDRGAWDGSTIVFSSVPARGTPAPAYICPQIAGRTMIARCCDVDCPGPTPRPTSTPTPVLTTSVVVKVPAPTGRPRRPLIGFGDRAMHPHYVSSGTNSAQITMSPAPPAGYASTYNADCTLQSDGTKTCTLNNVVEPLGVSETYVASLYSGAGETGTLLGRGSTTFTIMQGVMNLINITASPVVVEVGLEFTGDVVASPVFGLTVASAQTFPLSVAAFDPIGNVIPSGNSATQYLDTRGVPFTVGAAVQLDPNSPAGTITLGAWSFAGPVTATTTGTYNGAALGAGATIVPTVTTSDPAVYVDPGIKITHS